jgi:hypothetical protein
MIPQTATHPTQTGQLAARPTRPVAVTTGIIQGGAFVTSGSLQDWSWFGFDLGTAIWPINAPTQKPRSQPAGSETEQRTRETLTTDAETMFEPALVSIEDDAMARMGSAARIGDERAFLAAKNAIDWDARPAEDFLRAVQLALGAGAHMAARNLAAQGATRHPDNADLQKYARVLAPPRVLRNDAPPHPGLRANRDWLMAHGNEYRGQWVALHDGRLLGAADSLAALKRLVDDTTDILLTKVF